MWIRSSNVRSFIFKFENQFLIKQKVAICDKFIAKIVSHPLSNENFINKIGEEGIRFPFAKKEQDIFFLQYLY